MALDGCTAHVRHYRTEYRSMNTTDLLDALRAAQTLDALDALDALIDDQASSGQYGTRSTRPHVSNGKG